VVVLTDRTVLDRQLQDSIYQFEHKTGVVEKIDTDSAQLARALTAGVPIIISTIHKFGFIQDKVQALPDRRYAIIVDEAHSSQSGEMAVTVKELLSDSTLAAKLEAEGEDLSAPDQLALRAALFRGPQANMSFFAFTATPKFKTLELFGHQGTPTASRCRFTSTPCARPSRRASSSTCSRATPPTSASSSSPSPSPTTRSWTSKRPPRRWPGSSTCTRATSRRRPRSSSSTFAPA
jgi:hypothetical protein